MRIYAESRLRQREYSRLYRCFKEFTMIREEIFKSNLALASRIKTLEGCVVECGVWRGGMIAAIAALLGPDRTYYLFDSFEGLRPAQAIDGEAALEWQRNTDSPLYFDNCKAPYEIAYKSMTLSGARKFNLVKGWFNETTPQHRVGEPIALLRLDGDWYESTMVCLENLFDRVVPGGLIILDDYYTWDGCSRALHDYLSRKSATERIQSFDGICFLVRSKS
jgi:O-methyltransferase